MLEFRGLVANRVLDKNGQNENQNVSQGHTSLKRPETTSKVAFGDIKNRIQQQNATPLRTPAGKNHSKIVLGNSSTTKSKSQTVQQTPVNTKDHVSTQNLPHSKAKPKSSISKEVPIRPFANHSQYPLSDKQINRIIYGSIYEDPDDLPTSLPEPQIPELKYLEFDKLLSFVFDDIIEDSEQIKRPKVIYENDDLPELIDDF